MLYAKELLESIPDDSPTVLEKGLLSAEILHAPTSAGSNRLVITAITRAQGKLSELLQRLVSLLNEERPGRIFDRGVKVLPNRYTVRFFRKDLN